MVVIQRIGINRDWYEDEPKCHAKDGEDERIRGMQYLRYLWEWTPLGRGDAA